MAEARSSGTTSPWPAWAALGAVAALWALLRALPTAWIDAAWVHGWLPGASARSAAAIDAIGVSLTGLAALATLLGAVWFVVASRRRLGRSRWVWAAAALLAFGPAFEWSWGVAYRRTPLAARLALPGDALPPSAYLALLDQLVAAAHDAAPGDPTRVALGEAWWGDAVAAGAACVAATDAVASDRATPLRLPSRIRRLPPGALLRAGFAGIQSPWWREPHVDGGLPPVAALSTALHELAHSAGWAGEAETDALAILAGLGCADRDVRFAAALQAGLLLRSEYLRAVGDDAGARARLEAHWVGFPDAAKDAWRALDAARRAHRSAPAERAVGVVYGTYLRTQGVAAGLADYGRAAVLVAAALHACDDGDRAPWCAYAATGEGGANR